MGIVLWPKISPFFHFLYAVSRHWGSLMTSGFLMGFLYIWQGTGHDVPHYIFWIIAIVGIFVACYKAWDEERLAKEKALSEKTSVELALTLAKAERSEPPSNPSFAPRSYKRREEDGRCGLTITNSGYAAYDVHIPDTTLGDSYILHFDGVFSQVAHQEEVFFSTWLEGINGQTTCDGENLFAAMREHNIEEVRLGIISKDGQPIPKWYVDDCTMIRDVQKRRDGLVLSRAGQRVIATPGNIQQ
jgi:hypothetical protein